MQRTALPDPLPLFATHFEHMCDVIGFALACSADAGRDFGGVLLHGGEERFYDSDDQPFPFRPSAHFARCAPLSGPGNWLLYRPGEGVRVLRSVEQSYWSEAPAELDAEIERVLRPAAASCVAQRDAWLGDVTDCAYVGPDPELALQLGVDPAGVRPGFVRSALDWCRAEKSAYEQACLRRAAERAGPGHAAAKRAAAAALCEREIHAAYLAASDQLDGETPYPNIIAWDEHAATLHYGSKDLRPPARGQVFLIDAGASYRGYASDVTRTVARPDASPVFRGLLRGMAELQQRLVESVAPGVEFVALHAAALAGVAALLSEAGVLRVSAAEAVERGIVHAFLPHGLGHHLGLQVHDVGGRQRGPAGGEIAPPASSPQLRTTRRLEAGHVVTIEPGLYFIPLLLAPLRETSSAALDWTLVDSLLSCGGIRIEDDVLVTEQGRENLSRPFVPIEVEF